jgi:cystathionine beta-lyase/cystathionine gamma-synthase
MTEPKPETQCVRPEEIPPSASEPLVSPIALSVVYKVGSLDDVDALYRKERPGYVYARDGHPNATQLANKIASLEGAEAGFIAASGMAAESAAMLPLLDKDSHVVLSEGLYGRTVTLVANELNRFGITHSFFDSSRPESLKDALTEQTKVVFVETLSNPLLRVTDIAGVAALCKGTNAKLIVDHTFAPLLCRPLELGADLVVHSLTKFIAGHSDVTLGFLGGSRDLIQRASHSGSTFGLSGNPFDCWLAMRGVATLGVRLPKACDNAMSISQRLMGHPHVHGVAYPGLPTHPDYAVACRMFRQGLFGTMVTIDLGDRLSADTFIKGLKHIPYAPSLGDVATTLSHPATTSHRFQSPEQWAKQGITPGLIRLSIGLEDLEDLWADLHQALAQIADLE